MVVLSAKFTILISWSPICIPLILLSAFMKLTSTSGAILYNSMESRHPWRTNIRVKGSDRRLLFLILYSILVYATWIMWMNLSPYPNLCKVEKTKSALRALKKDYLFIQFIWLVNYVTNSTVYSKVILFLIASDWWFSIIAFKYYLQSILKNCSIWVCLFITFFIFDRYDSCSRSNTHGAKLSPEVIYT